MRTYEVGGESAIAEPSGGPVAKEVDAVWQEVALEGGIEDIVVSWVYAGVPKDEQAADIGSPCLLSQLGVSQQLNVFRPQCTLDGQQQKQHHHHHGRSPPHSLSFYDSSLVTRDLPKNGSTHCSLAVNSGPMVGAFIDTNSGNNVLLLNVKHTNMNFFKKIRAFIIDTKFLIFFTNA